MNTHNLFVPVRRHRIILPAAAVLATAIALAACGGGGHSAAPIVPGTSGAGTSGTGGTTTAPANNARASFSITIPAKPADGNTRSNAYISASTQSMTFALVNGTTTTQLAAFDTTPTSPGCSAVPSGGTQCAETFGAPSGQSMYVVTAYDATGGKGNVLSSATVQATLTAGTNNTVPLVLNGNATKATVVLGAGSLQVGSPGSTSVGIMATDAQNNIIVGPGAFAAPIGLAITGDTWNTLTLSGNKISAPGQLVTLAYNGNSLVGATISPSASGLTGTAATFAGSGVATAGFSGPDFNAYAGCNTYNQPSPSPAPSPLPTVTSLPTYPAYAEGYNYFYDVAPMGTNQVAAEVYTEVYCQSYGWWLEQDGLATVSSSGTTQFYFGDTSDPLASPTPLPSPGTTPAPPPGVHVIQGMSTNVEEEPGYGYTTVAAMGTKIFYGAEYNNYNGTYNSQPATLYGLGIIGALDTAALTTKETKLSFGEPMYVRLAPNGTVFFIEDTAYWYTNNPCCSSGPLSNDGSNNYVYLVGAIDASGNLLYEKTFSSLGIPASDNTYPSDMTLAPDGSAMYIADYGSVYRIIKLPISGSTVGSGPTFANLGQAYPYAIAAGADGNVVTMSGNEPGEYYDWSYVPAASFLTSSVVTQPFPSGYAYSYSVAYADGSYWAADYDYGGIMRIANPGKAVMSRLPSVFTPSDYSSDSCGITAAAGAVWAADCDYGGLMWMAYGAPPNGVPAQVKSRGVAGIRHSLAKRNFALQRAYTKDHTKTLSIFQALAARHSLFAQ